MDDYSVDQLLLAQRHCFINDEGYMICNFVIRNGCVILLQSGKCHRFKAGGWKKKKTQQANAESSVAQFEKA